MALWLPHLPIGTATGLKRGDHWSVQYPEIKTPRDSDAFLKGVPTPSQRVASSVSIGPRTDRTLRR